MVYLYSITSPSLYVYIGVTNKPDLRFSQHARANTPVGRAIRKYGQENMIYDLIAFGTESEIYFLESSIVTQQFLDTVNTYNQVVGGKTGTSFAGNKHSEESKNKISESLKGRVFSDEHKQKIGEKNKLRKGIRLSLERRLACAAHLKQWRANASEEQLSKLLQRNPHSEETKRKISDAHSKGAAHHNAKPILQYSPDGVFIAEHGSIALASRATGLTQNVISKCLSHKVKNPKWVFEYKTNGAQVTTVREY